MGQSKRRISALPFDWQGKLLSHAAQKNMETKNQAIAPLCVLAATGCRPSELAQGVKVRRTDKGWQFEIKGTKVGETGGSANAKQKRGIPLRVITVELDAKSVWQTQLNRLYKADCAASKPFEISISSGDAIATKMRRLVDEIWPNLKNKPSPYSFRHTVAADMRRQGAEVVEVAKVLGHASCSSQSKYGWTRRGGKGGLKRSAVASVAPRGAEATQATKNPAKGSLERFKVASKLRKQNQATKPASTSRRLKR